MLAILLSFLLVSPPNGGFTVTQGFSVTRAELPKPQSSRKVVATHNHRCPRCGNVWAHGDDSFGKVQDHICPSCGFGPVWNVYQRFR